jgi:hypothetical protein
MTQATMGRGCRPGTDPCGRSPYELPRFFPGQLLTDDELRQEQQYFRDRMRLHNRLLWGWGTVCGAVVCRVPASPESAAPDPWKVVVKPGYVLGPYGDDIVLDREVTVDLRTGGVSGSNGEAPEVSAEDPWCSRVCLPREPGPVYVAVRYRECLTRPVRVQPSGCGCSGEACEYSRVRDGYEIGLLDCCPPSHEGDPPEFSACGDKIPACPPCPDDPWVVLAKVEIGTDGIVGEPDNCSCRRIVVSLARFWCRCRDEAPCGDEGRRPTIDAVVVKRPDGTPAPPELKRGDEVVVTVTGRGLGRASRIDLPAGFEVVAKSSTDTTVTATIKVTNAARPGAHALRVVDSRGHVVAEQADAIRVKSAREPGEPGGGERPEPPPKEPAPAPRPRNGKRGGSPGGGGR